MKKILAVFLALIILLGLCACGDSEPENTLPGQIKFDTFVAGFGKVDVTPLEPVHLAGFGSHGDRLSTGVKDEIMTLTTALSDTKGNTLLIIISDFLYGDIALTNVIRALVKDKFGIPGEYVLVGTTHNHNGPDFRGTTNASYMEYWRQNVVRAVEMALNDRKPASIQIGAGETEGQTFVRRFFRADGCLTGAGYADRYPDCKEPIVAYETEGDEEAQFVKFVREDGKDILIAQWQCHAALYGNSTIMSTDWVGPMRNKMEQELDCHVMYMQGCSANMNPNTQAPFTAEHPVVSNVITKGEMIADDFIAMCNSENFFTTVNSGDIQVKQEKYSDTGTYRPQYWEVELTSVGIGDLSLVTIPMEMWAEDGVRIKEGTPYAMTLLMSYTNGMGGYIASREAFHNGGYGVVDGYANENTADNMVKIWLDSLKELHG